MVEGQQQHDARADAHDDHPGLGQPEALGERPRQIDEAAIGEDLGQVIEGALPARVHALLLGAELLHVDAVASDVVHRPTDRHDTHDPDRHGKEARQWQGE